MGKPGPSYKQMEPPLEPTEAQMKKLGSFKIKEKDLPELVFMMIDPDLLYPPRKGGGGTSEWLRSQRRWGPYWAYIAILHPNQNKHITCTCITPVLKLDFCQKIVKKEYLPGDMDSATNFASYHVKFVFKDHPFLFQREILAYARFCISARFGEISAPDSTPAICTKMPQK